MKFNVKQLKKRIEDLPDDAIVCIERIQDVCFDKYGWETEMIVFQEKDGIPFDSTTYLDAFSSIYSKNKNKLIIVAHY